MSKYNFEQKRNDYMSPYELVYMALKEKNAPFFDLDGEVEQLTDEIAVCRNYERIE